MATHAFNDPDDPTRGGTWYGDYGRHLCRWTWDSFAKTLQVTCGPKGKRVHLSGVDFSTANLRERLPQIAREAAERIAQGK